MGLGGLSSAAFPPSRLMKSHLSPAIPTNLGSASSTGAVAAAPIPSISKGFFGCVSEQRHRRIPTLPSPALTLISLLFFVLPKGQILCVPKVAKLQFCVSHQEFPSAAPSQHPPGWGRRSRPQGPGEASRFRQIRILIIHSKARQSINKGKMIHRGEWDEQRKRPGAFPWPQNVEQSRKGGSSPTTRSCCPAQPEETEFWWRREREMPPDANPALPARL